ncbi:glycoside hydrolase family 10 protein [Serpula lacrymans var. lacrymans S7.3]|uniref:Beta-xylanase n=2 Tax=Serpula lacrymans var. lacrymans TaxID=341189 RepID=F8QIE4_SERL3|nr:glycoside hydrolase family 10 protein [Serpula lacrymans var. lacrymans S7.9]EGN91911.1 glycoside hydrolase family 10 protein [Serpula lacrymans var. lacrymans S7.3]EGO24451.1 glycoside hydrolase family 10 protein [Serpula lacrymans var. lacrymans S7.9]
MIFSLGFATLLSLLQVATAQTTTATSTAPGATSTVPLNYAAQAAGKLYFGSATDNPELTDVPYVTILNDTAMFGQLTPGNSMKWDAIEPEQNVFNFTGGDQIVALAEGTGKIMRGHNLVWYSQLPAWVTATAWTADELTSIIQTHVTTEVSHYVGKIYAWDVINEPLNDNGTFRSDIFYDTLGSSYISIALRAARAADPNAKLYINEYNLEYSGPKIDAMVQLVSDLKAEGVPIDGIGIESHYILGEVSASELKANMLNLTSLGVDVAFTELDVRIELPATDADLEQQKSDYTTIVSVCMEVADCVGVTVWDYTDKYSWIPASFPGYGEACPWDENLVKKPAYDGIVAGLQS